MAYLILKFRKIMLGYNHSENEETDIIYGYKISNNKKEDKILVLEKLNDKYWKTRWVTNSNSKKIIEPLKTLTSIFT